ncbi:MAG: sugar ABC transporter permease [Acidimicrobiia bacterium]|nr:sugar ABC transporter permease [Acidimicrobiia bacterium]
MRDDAPTTERPATTPWWFGPLLAWRVITAAGLIALAGAVVFQVGFDFDGVVRITAGAGLIGLSLLAVTAAAGVARRRHRGRLVGFVTDGLLAVSAGFVALNRIGVFSGLDVAGEAFNQSVQWAAVIVLGWLIRGLANRGETENKRLLQIGTFLMWLGLAVLLIAMGLLPGLLEVSRRLLWTDVIGYAVVSVAAIAACRLQWSDSATPVFGSSQRQTETMEGLLFVAPNALGFLTFFAGPLIASFFFSFTEWDGLTDATFVGLDNYRDLLTDDLFLRSLRNIVVFGIVAIPLAVMPALILAALLNADLPGMRLFRAAYFLPSIAGVVGVTLIWKQLFNSTVGYINYVLLRATDLVNTLLGTDFVSAQPQWISDSSIALVAVMILFAWQQIGFNTVLFLAGMQGINRELYEAADIDGAGALTKFWRLTVPMLRSTTVFVVATTTILALQMFNEPFILQSPSSPAGPNNSTLTPVIYLYQNAFQQFEIGYASAVAWALFILTFAISLLYFRRGEQEELRL